MRDTVVAEGPSRTRQGGAFPEEGAGAEGTMDMRTPEAKDVATGNLLRENRHRRHVRQWEIAEELHLARSMVSSLECGRRRWSETVIKKYLAYLED